MATIFGFEPLFWDPWSVHGDHFQIRYLGLGSMECSWRPFSDLRPCFGLHGVFMVTIFRFETLIWAPWSVHGDHFQI
jgi:hypothetical protein